MIKLTLRDLDGIKVGLNNPKVGETFETDMLDRFRGLYRIVSITSRDIHAERISWVLPARSLD
jgi:hypothetical protein